MFWLNLHFHLQRGVGGAGQWGAADLGGFVTCSRANPRTPPPPSALRRGVPFATFFPGLLAAVAGAQERHGISASLITCFLRDLGAEAAEQTLAQVGSMRGGAQCVHVHACMYVDTPPPRLHVPRRVPCTQLCTAQACMPAREGCVLSCRRLQAGPYLQHISGVGLDSTEVGFPPNLFRDVFARAAELGLHRVAHTGGHGVPIHFGWWGWLGVWVCG